MTSQVLFNQFAYVDRLKSGGFSDDQARAAAEALAGALSETVATSSQLTAVETKLDGKIDTTEATLRAEIEKSKNSLLVWLIALIAGSTITISGVILTALRGFGKAP